MHIVDLDAAGVRAVAGRFEAVAQLVAADALLTFGASSAGRRYSSEGDALRQSCALRVDELAGWAHAARAVSDELRSAADCYEESERHSVARIG